MNQVLTHIGDKYIDSNYNHNSDEWKDIITTHFQWIVGSYKNPFDSKFTCSEDETVSTLLFRKNEKEPLVEVLRVQKSNIPNAGLGLFAQKMFQKGDYISVYVGTRKEGVIQMDDPFYGLKVTSNYTLCLDADDLLLGAHMGNDSNHVQQKYNIKGGRPRVNNSMLEGIFLRATTQVRVGDEIKYTYNME